MKVKHILIALLLIVVVFQFSVKASAVTTFNEVGCVIRNSGSGWKLIGGAHYPLNIASVTNDNTKIRITYSFTATYVVTTAVTVDDTMSREGYVVGASVGLGYMDILISRDKQAVNPNDYVSSGGNIWVYGKFIT